LKKAVYVTTAKPSEGSGGGVVALHEIKALNPSLVVSMSEQSPFLNDYFCLWKIKNEAPFELAHFYGTPFGLAAEYLKKQGAKILATVPAHNLERSVEEHIKLFGQYPYNHMTDPYLWNIYSHHIKIADTVICPSKMSADYIKQKLALTKDPTIIRHGCNLPKEPAPLPEIFTVGHLSQVGPDKGQIYLVQAWNSLKLPNARIFIAGQGTEQLGGAGYIPDEKAFHNSISILVQPSVTEGYGIPVLSAMANARPVIVTEGAGVHEIVENGKEGFVVPIRDPLILAEKIRYFHEHPDEIKRMGQNARVKAQHFSWDRIEKEYQKAYEECLL
jgi:glycosyltransferase involved in cell wall biosynthesis